MNKTTEDNAIVANLEDDMKTEAFVPFFLLHNDGAVSLIETSIAASESETFIPAIAYPLGRRQKMTTYRIDKWIRPMKTVVIVSEGNIIAATEEANTLSHWIDVRMGIFPSQSWFRRTVLWTAAEVASANPRLIARCGRRCALPDFSQVSDCGINAEVVKKGDYDWTDNELTKIWEKISENEGC
jgi:hypothetical protein